MSGGGCGHEGGGAAEEEEQEGGRLEEGRGEARCSFFSAVPGCQVVVCCGVTERGLALFGGGERGEGGGQGMWGRWAFSCSRWCFSRR